MNYHIGVTQEEINKHEQALIEEFEKFHILNLSEAADIRKLFDNTYEILDTENKKNSVWWDAVERRCRIPHSCSFTSRYYGYEALYTRFGLDINNY